HAGLLGHRDIDYRRFGHSRSSLTVRLVWSPSIYQRVPLCANLLRFDLDHTLSQIHSLLRGATYCVEHESRKDTAIDLINMAENLTDDAKELAEEMYKSAKQDAPGSDQTAGGPQE